MVKYIIKALVEVDGPVDEHDIIGAIFGQTEGLLDDFDLRELQEKGRIGRILVKLQRRGNKAVGEIYVPSNLDRVETALVAAMLESVDKVGPYPARISVVEIIDVRAEKIKKIIERAKEILKKWSQEKSVDIREILKEISETTKKSQLIEYGPEKLPAGPGVERSDTIIIVEGRADVLNLLRYGYDNVIALGGATTKVPETIKKLAKEKIAIAFVDGDRGGLMVLKNLLSQADIDYVARAPPGKEVEDLTAREIAKSLSNLIPASKMKEELLKVEKLQKEEVKEVAEKAEKVEAEEVVKKEEVAERGEEMESKAEGAEQPTATALEKAAAKEEVKQEVKTEEEKVKEYVMFIPDSVFEKAKEITGTLRSVLYDSQWNIVAEVPAKDVVSAIEEKGAYAVLHDGVITQRMLDVMSLKGGRLILGRRVARVSKRPKGVFVVLLS
ncbi:DNA primase DnaG [Ignicoccus hospitalis]|uniref:DNA primase DnaG n=1 Tax=Ignicoccus hospitalis (strain KIN4/I / DSM 18386 / JCM 14125) TaxID=453591 RepID=DNAG_IGNH4|nr:DNA primase DnaG [Ignicoccus hospitalis]A8A8J3.1 RecName: Full=DNA primase DnaG [Ignicoccus hospitalis KIN4/I]ABU81245.1 TOPRIM domain protein [Ignicoccus hospitalis KIN4/I]HIH90927.1 DNA primase [Desulfurococcaceae archaeon]